MSSCEHSEAFVQGVVHHVFLACISSLDFGSQHVCSPAAPCIVARDLLAPFLALKLVAPSWNTAVKARTPDTFFSNLEEGVYYPHSWHINTRMRKASILSRYRVFKTIHSEDGDRGVYLAYDFGGPKGCAEASEVVIKAWVSGSDVEFLNETGAYKVLDGCVGVPQTFGPPQYDPACDIHVLPMQKLGPTLEDLMLKLPKARFDARMVLMVAIQMIERYRDIHTRGIIHSGTKPGNICLAPPDTEPRGMLYLIDFGFAIPLADSPLPNAHRIDVVGNRRFMSVLAHHGICKSQRDDLESLAYLLSHLFHGELPWDMPLLSRLRSYRPGYSITNGKEYRQQIEQQSQLMPQVWRLKMATPPSKLFEGMNECFLEFWRDVKALSYGEIPDYERMRARFAACLQEHEECDAPVNWWELYKQ
ncbi:kinase-like domain-containing protein [Roridomyces roridus]|uniref:Kinase-like domain-containing protein n=1 Tax=Roridomyces roridus TaxID=1738132 RepID=A0AAD7BRU9_9AGAR|nr:kinase-like domain-containing protein [Roridomyces roridus]